MINRGKLLFYGMVGVLVLSTVLQLTGIALLLYAIITVQPVFVAVAFMVFAKGTTWLYIAYNWFTSAA